jgi:hypothetical protein
LQELGVALSATYRSLSGLAAPIFVIDPQEVVDGVLHMQVLEAELESFELADADGFDEHDIAPRCLEHTHGLGRGCSHTAQMAARCHGPDEDTRIRGVLLHADAITEQRSTGKGRAGVDGEHADPLAA